MQPGQVLDYWFAGVRDDVDALPERMRFWFGGHGDTQQDVATRDAELRGRLGPVLENFESGALDIWRDTPAGRLALILLTDQVPRNIHRGNAAAFALDGQARALCVEGLDLEHDRALGPFERLFFYLPLEHSESIDDQRRCVALCEQLERAAPTGLAEAFVGFTRFARWHLDIVERFGRFPHRNRALGRISTPEEAAYLAAQGPSFGQG